MIHIGGVPLPDCTELGVDARGPGMSVGELEFQRTTATLWREDENTVPTAIHIYCFAS